MNLHNHYCLMSALWTFEGPFYSPKVAEPLKVRIIRRYCSSPNSHVYIHTQMCMYTQAYMNTQANKHTRKYTHTYAQAHTQTCTKVHTCILSHTPTCMQQTKTWHYTNTHVIICNTQSNICCVGLLRENNNLTWHTNIIWYVST